MVNSIHESYITKAPAELIYIYIYSDITYQIEILSNIIKISTAFDQPSSQPQQKHTHGDEGANL